MSRQDVEEHRPALSDQHFSYDVSETFSGVRVDIFLVQCIPDVSRSLVTASLRAGLIVVDNKRQKASYKLKAGQCVSGVLQAQPDIQVKPEQISFDILFEDAHLLVVAKPPHLVVHPGSGNPSGTLVNGLVHYCNEISSVGDAVRPGIVHRLDKDTSGVMVVAKTQEVHRALVQAFSRREVEKHYFALVHGRMQEATGRIVASIGRHPVSRQKMAIREKSGRHAVTNWQVVDLFDAGYTSVRLKIETGRTHQIRVHMASLGHPVAGDRVYGSRRDNTMFPRQLLHALQLAFTHPVTGERLVVEAPLWPDFATILDELQRRQLKERQGER